MERSKVACPRAAMPSEKYEYPRPSSHWLQGSIAAPRNTPIATRPVGPIQSLSKAYLRNRQTATMRARMPRRLNQLPPMRASRSCEFVLELWAIVAKVWEVGTDGAVDRAGDGSGEGAGRPGDGGEGCCCGVTPGAS